MKKINDKIVPKKTKEVDLKSLVNFGSDMGQIWGRTVSY